VKTAWLTGSLRKKEKEAANVLIASGEAQLVIGTHALIQDNVQFKKLGLVIVDEQHRFGVSQRLNLANKAEAGKSPASVDDVSNTDPAHTGDDLFRRSGSVRD
jgi:ATP-dependent DNA helicase RecG